MQRDAEASFQLVAQIHAPPAHHPMTNRIGASLNQLGQFGLLLRCEFWLGTWRLQIVQAAQALSVVAMHPIPKGLAIHAAGLGCRLAIRSIEHHCKSQHPPRCRTVLLPPRCRPKLRRRQINPCDRYRPTHRRLLLSHEQASSQSFLDLGIPK